MTKAHLYCPNERVFLGNLLMYRPGLPGSVPNAKSASRLEVEVIGADGSNALVVLPSILSQGNETALIDINYLILD